MKDVKNMNLPEMRKERNALVDKRINNGYLIGEDVKREKELNTEIELRIKEINKKNGWSF